MRYFAIFMLLTYIVFEHSAADMTEKGWTRATEQCASFGGLKSADESTTAFLFTSGTTIKARCKQGHTVRAVYQTEAFKP
jgi:hypothetical protein